MVPAGHLPGTWRGNDWLVPVCGDSGGEERLERLEEVWSSLITQTLVSVINGELELVSCIVTDQKAGKG